MLDILDYCEIVYVCFLLCIPRINMETQLRRLISSSKILVKKLHHRRCVRRNPSVQGPGGGRPEQIEPSLARPEPIGFWPTHEPFWIEPRHRPCCQKKCFSAQVWSKIFILVILTARLDSTLSRPVRRSWVRLFRSKITELFFGPTDLQNARDLTQPRQVNKRFFSTPGCRQGKLLRTT